VNSFKWPSVRMFDLRGKELFCRKELLSTITKFYEGAGYMWVDLKLKSRTSYVRCFQVIYTSKQNTRHQSR